MSEREGEWGIMRERDIEREWGRFEDGRERERGREGREGHGGWR